MFIVKVNTEKQGIRRAYLTLFNGSLKLTDRELDLLSALLDKHSELEVEGLNEPFISNCCVGFCLTYSLVLKFGMMKCFPSSL